MVRRGDSELTVTGELVVDNTGKMSKFPQWLKQAFAIDDIQIFGVADENDGELSWLP